MKTKPAIGAKATETGGVDGVVNPMGLSCGIPQMEPRITPDQLRELAKVMIEMDIIDMASGDTRIILGRTPRGRPLQPIEKQLEIKDQEDDEDLMYGAVT